MSCVLRIFGTDLDPEALLAATGLVAYRVDRKGQTGVLKNRGPFAKSAVHIDVSDADFSDLPGQVRDATEFLSGHEAPIRAAVGFPGVETVTLDFPVEHADVSVDCKYLNPDFLSLVGKLMVGIEISIYPESEPSAPR